MKTIITLFISFILLSNSFAFGQKVSKNFLDGEVYVKIKSDVPFLFDTLHRKVDIKTKLPFLIPLVNKYNITKAEASFYFSHSNTLKRTFRIHFGKSELVARFIAEMKKLNQVEHVEKIPLVYNTHTSNNRGLNNNLGFNTYASQNALDNNNNYIPNDFGLNQYTLNKIHAPEAWNVSRGSRSLMIAVIGNAIDVNHEDLSANVVKQWDIADDDANVAPPPSSNIAWWSGTAIAGIACATTNNGKGIASIGFNCGLMAIKINSDDDTSPESSFSDDAYEGIAWAVENGAKVICFPYTFGPSSTLESTINDAYDHNAIVIAPVGSSSSTTLYYPAAYSHVVAVAYVDSLDRKDVSSNYGSWVDVSAPGDLIYSTIPGNRYTEAGSEGIAVSMVAGLCGLIWSANPLLSNDEIVNTLINTTDNIDAQNPGFEGQLGSGRINAFRAVESALLCKPSINLGTGTFQVPKTESSGTITSKNTIPAGEQVIFDAATKVDLLPGFTAKNGSVFRAYIDGCGNKFALADNKRSSTANQIVADQKEENISVDELPKRSLNVFPNPARSILNVNLNGLQTGRYNLVVSNISGNTIKQKAITISGAKTTVQLSVDDIPAGIYILRIAENPKINAVKFIKE